MVRVVDDVDHTVLVEVVVALSEEDDGALGTNTVTVVREMIDGRLGRLTMMVVGTFDVELSDGMSSGNDQVGGATVMVVVLVDGTSLMMVLGTVVTPYLVKR